MYFSLLKIVLRESDICGPQKYKCGLQIFWLYGRCLQPEYFEVHSAKQKSVKNQLRQKPTKTCSYKILPHHGCISPVSFFKVRKIYLKKNHILILLEKLLFFLNHSENSSTKVFLHSNTEKKEIYQVFDCALRRQSSVIILRDTIDWELQIVHWWSLWRLTWNYSLHSSTS